MTSVKANATNDYGNHLYSLRERPAVNYSIVSAKAKPVVIQLGVFWGYELPVSNWSDDQYLFLTHSVPRRWNGTTNPTYSIAAVLGTANTDVKFQLRVSWEHYTPNGDTLVATSHDVDVETAVTGAKAQYFSYKVDFTIDYDVEVARPILAGDILALKVGRIAKTAGGTEATGNIIVFGGVIQYAMNKIGVSV